MPPKKPSPLEDRFAALLDKYKIKYEREVAFNTSRRFRLDFLVKITKRKPIAVEVMGAVWKGRYGGHTSGKGMIRDAVKAYYYHTLGWDYLIVIDCDKECSIENIALYLKTLKPKRKKK